MESFLASIIINSFKLAKLFFQSNYSFLKLVFKTLLRLIKSDTRIYSNVLIEVI